MSALNIRAIWWQFSFQYNNHKTFFNKNNFEKIMEK